MSFQRSKEIDAVEKRCLDKLPGDARKVILELELCPCSAWAIYNERGYVALMKYIKGAQ